MTKIIANYLPQYHCIPENDKWWGKGFTDWIAVQKAVPLYKGHDQPRVPMDHHYYRLDDVDEIRRQVRLSREYGIDGFGIYHYWFNSDMHLLDKPPILIRDNKDIDIQYCFIWDNASWKRTWSNLKSGNDWAPMYDENSKLQAGENGELAAFRYGDEKDWKVHFDYLLSFFRDDRYIKIQGKPVFCIFNQNNSPELLTRMKDYWGNLAKQNGFPGIYLIGRRNRFGINPIGNEILYEPEWNGWTWKNQISRVLLKIQKEMHIKVLHRPFIYNYDDVWKRIIKDAKKCSSEDVFLSGFVSYDDSPRRGKKARIIRGSTPAKFGQYMKELIEISNTNEKELLFVTAWNEWGEGAYLEPDEANGYAYLEALKRAKDSCLG